MLFRLAVALCCLATPVFAGDIVIEDAYARASRPTAPTAAMFMTIRNAGAQSDLLLGVSSPAAQMVELHTHIDEGGVMKMRPVDGGIEIPAGGTHMLRRGGDHVMLMGLTQPFEEGATVPLVLTFQQAGDVAVDVVVDNERQQGTLKGN